MNRPPVIALSWTIADGDLVKVSVQDDPSIRQKALGLANTPSRDVLG